LIYHWPWRESILDEDIPLPPIEREREFVQCNELGQQALRLRLDATALRLN
jgi:hypothetical protein